MVLILGGKPLLLGRLVVVLVYDRFCFVYVIISRKFMSEIDRNDADCIFFFITFTIELCECKKLPGKTVVFLFLFHVFFVCFTSRHCLVTSCYSSITTAPLMNCCSTVNYRDHLSLLNQ